MISVNQIKKVQVAEQDDYKELVREDAHLFTQAMYTINILVQIIECQTKSLEMIVEFSRIQDTTRKAAILTGSQIVLTRMQNLKELLPNSIISG